MRMFLSLYVATCLSVAALSLAQSFLSLSPATKASNAAVFDSLDPSFAGFGIEPSNLFSFTGHTNSNNFSIQLLQNLADYAGAPPHIRLGGNTQDYMIFDGSYDAYDWKANPGSTAQGAIAADSIIVGPGYFKALDRFPKDTPITFGLNLAYEGSDYSGTITRMAQAAIDHIQTVKLYSFEIGNEPDLWLENQFRSGAWDGQAYTQQFLDRAEIVYTNVLKPAGMASNFFETPATASTIGTTFEIAMLVKDGLSTAVNGTNFVSCWNQHDYFYYIGVSTYVISLEILMNLDKTNEQFAYWEEQVNISRTTSLPYALREMASVGPIGMHEVSDTFGAALWTLNFFLYTASIGISSVQMHMTDNSNASAWQPIEMYENKPFVRPQYYAHAAMAQIIGNGNGTTQVASIRTDNVAISYKGFIRAYSVYANGVLQSMVLINSKPANASESSRASFMFEVNFGSSNSNKDIYLSYLTADGADSLSGTTFNGMAFSDLDGKASQADNIVNKLTASSSGKVSISVRDTQAVVANVGWLLGSNAVLNNGTAAASKKTSTGHSSTSRASTAAMTGAATTTLSLAASLTGGGGNVEETGMSTTSGEAEVQGRSKILWALGISLFAVTIGFVILA